MVSQGQVILHGPNGRKLKYMSMIQTLISGTKISSTIILIVVTLKTRHQYKTASLLT
jgi:hypothetical protein